MWQIPWIRQNSSITFETPWRRWEKGVALSVQGNLETCQWPEDWKPKEFVILHKSGTELIALISHTNKTLLVIILNNEKEN